MKDIQRAYLWVYGGYGDCVCGYRPSFDRRGSLLWDRLIPMKRKFPHVETTAVIVSGNKQSKVLIERNPLIDNVIYSPTPPMNVIGKEVREFIRKLAVSRGRDIDSIERLKKLPKAMNPIHLTEDERTLFNEIMKHEKVVLFHPFASIEDRRCINMEESYRVADRAASLGAYVVVVGKTYTRRHVKDNLLIEESWDFQRDNVLNLVNNDTASMPFASELVLKGAGVMGNWSCHTTLGAYEDKETLVFLNSRRVKNFNNIQKHSKKPCIGKTYCITDTGKVNMEEIDRFIERLRKA